MNRLHHKAFLGVLILCSVGWYTIYWQISCKMRYGDIYSQIAICKKKTSKNMLTWLHFHKDNWGFMCLNTRQILKKNKKCNMIGNKWRMTGRNASKLGASSFVVLCCFAWTYCREQSCKALLAISSDSGQNACILRQMTRAALMIQPSHQINTADEGKGSLTRYQSGQEKFLFIHKLYKYSFINLVWMVQPSVLRTFS